MMMADRQQAAQADPTQVQLQSHQRCKAHIMLLLPVVLIIAPMLCLQPWELVHPLVLLLLLECFKPFLDAVLMLLWVLPAFFSVAAAVIWDLHIKKCQPLQTALRATGGVVPFTDAGARCFSGGSASKELNDSQQMCVRCCCSMTLVAAAGAEECCWQAESLQGRQQGQLLQDRLHVPQERCSQGGGGPMSGASQPKAEQPDSRQCMLRGSLIELSMSITQSLTPGTAAHIKAAW